MFVPPTDFSFIKRKRKNGNHYKYKFTPARTIFVKEILKLVKKSNLPRSTKKSPFFQKEGQTKRGLDKKRVRH